MFAIEFALEKICHHIRTLELVLSVSLIHSLKILLSRWGLRFQIRSDSKQGCSRLIDKRIEAIEKNRKSPPSSGASAFVLDIFSNLH